MNLYQQEPEQPSERPHNAGRAVPLLTGVSLLLIFVMLVAGVRETFVAPDVERTSFGGPGHFGILTEAMRVFEATAGVPLLPDQDDINRTISFMAFEASGDRDFGVVDSVLSEVRGLEGAVPRTVPPGLEDVWRALHILQRDYPDAPLEDVTEAARRGLFFEGADPALTFLDSSQYENAQQYFADGSYEGIGARVGTNGGISVITEVFLGGPAEVAGLQAGDGILSVNGVSVLGMNVGDVVERVKGESGTEVVLEIRRPWNSPESDAQMTVSVVRGEVPTSLEARVLGAELGESIGYIRVERFHRETGNQFGEALEDLLERDITGLILDLRFNPGGSLSGAVSMISEFVPDGMAMYEVGRDGERTGWMVDGDGQAYDLPLAVLVNEYSASASEVVAGALQDHDRAMIYGRGTFGKGTVQVFKQLSDGSALSITVSNWHTPDGRQIQDTGIMPDIPIVPTIFDVLNEQDPVLVAAFWDLVDEQQSAPAA